MGRTVEECARITGKSEWDFVKDLLVEERLQSSMVVFAMTEDNVRLFLSHPLGMPASDGSVYSPQGPLSKPFLSSPYGTFPWFRKIRREEKLMDFAEAVKITSLPASRPDFKDRGLLLRDTGQMWLFLTRQRLDKLHLQTSPFSGRHSRTFGVNGVIPSKTELRGVPAEWLL